MKNYQKEFRLLPNYFKSIGAGIILFWLFIILPGIGLLNHSSFYLNNKSLARIITYDTIIAGLFLFSMAKDKVEDELLLLIRMQSLVFALIFGVLMFIVQPLVNFFFYDEFLEVASFQLVLTMLLTYNFYFIIKKKML